MDGDCCIEIGDRFRLVIEVASLRSLLIRVGFRDRNGLELHEEGPPPWIPKKRDLSGLAALNLTLYRFFLCEKTERVKRGPAGSISGDFGEID